MRYIFYHTLTGELHREVKHLPKEWVASNTPQGYTAVANVYAHPDSHRFNLQNGEIEEYRSISPSSDHEWDGDLKRWVIGSEARARRVVLAEIAGLEGRQARAIREALLGRGGFDRLREIDDQIAELRKKLQQPVRGSQGP